MSTERCASCGDEIPEGKMICKRCEARTLAPLPDTIVGVPFDEAVKVLTLYKAGVPYTSKEYILGFEDGYKRARADLEEAWEKWMKTSRI